MKKFIMVLALMLVATSVSGADNLHQYYGEQGEVLPSIQERAELSYEAGLTGVKYGDSMSELEYEYTGTYSQNVALLSYLQESSILGITIPKVVALFETSLKSKVTSSATSMTLVTGTDKAGTALSGTIGFIIDEGTTSEEFVICTAAGTALTSCSRGISVVDGETEVAALQYEHRRGASVKISNFPQLALLSRVLNGNEGIPNAIFYETNLDTGTASSSWIVDKNYVDNTTNQGAATSTETNSGISELATRTEQASSTPFDADNPHVMSSENATSTPYADSIGAGYVCVTEDDGNISKDCMPLSEAITWTGTQTFDGTVLVNGTTLFTGSNVFSSTSTFTAFLGGSNAHVMTAGETITGYALPVPVYISTSTGKIMKADANDEDKLEYIGFAVTTEDDGELIWVQTEGIVDGFTGLSAGSIYYVQDTVGTIGTATGTSIVTVGKAISTTQINIEKKEWEYISSDTDATGAYSFTDVPVATDYIRIRFCDSPAGGDSGYSVYKVAEKGAITTDSTGIYTDAGHNASFVWDLDARTLTGTGPAPDDTDCNATEAHYYR